MALKKIVGRAAKKIKGAKGVKAKVKAKLRGKVLPKEAKPITRRRRGMFIRRGRLFIGFAMKEIKTALRRTYGGRRKR